MDDISPDRPHPTCGACYFYTPMGGMCLRHAPIGAGDHGASQWPVVSSTRDWCGDFRYDQRLPREKEIGGR